MLCPQQQQLQLLGGFTACWAELSVQAYLNARIYVVFFVPVLFVFIWKHKDVAS